MPLPESIPAITIGLPCYGRPTFLKEALDHLLSQTFTDFEIHVSENPSGAEDIREIVEACQRAGAPIRHHRHATNIGVLRNFVSVLEGVQSPFFLWAADDDLRHPESLAILHALLTANPDRALAACSVEVINIEGQTIDHHPGFSRFSAPAGQGLASFLTEPEICGKANIIYGLFRTEALRATLATTGGGLPEGWGPDLVFLSAFLSRFGVIGTDRVLLRKRTNNARMKPLAKRFPGDFGWPRREYAGLRARILAALPDTPLRAEAAAVLDTRQRHIAGLGGLRRGAMKALGLDASAPLQPASGDVWAGGSAP
jgi:glycosyltransferase involved in cell wall biosynthesis